MYSHHVSSQIRNNYGASEMTSTPQFPARLVNLPVQMRDIVLIWYILISILRTIECLPLPIN